MIRRNGELRFCGSGSYYVEVSPTGSPFPVSVVPTGTPFHGSKTKRRLQIGASYWRSFKREKHSKQASPKYRTLVLSNEPINSATVFILVFFNTN